MKRNMRRAAFADLMLASLVAFTHASEAAANPFTVADDITIAQFGVHDFSDGAADAIQLSPDGQYIAAHVERGRLDLDRAEDTIRVYRTQELQNFVQRKNGAETLVPLWAFSRSTDKYGPIFKNWRWLSKSNGLAFIQHFADGSERLVLADLKTKLLQLLTPKGQHVKAFDIRDRNHYVYVVATAITESKERELAEYGAASFVGTGRALYDLQFPLGKYPAKGAWYDRGELWACVDGKRAPITDRFTGRPLVLFTEGQSKLALSPNGQAVITAMAIPEVPSSWETLYPPPYASAFDRLRAGRQDLGDLTGWRFVSQFVLIDLKTRAIESLSNSPTSKSTGWGASTWFTRPSWSENGHAVLLPGAYLASLAHTPSRPCIVFVELKTGAQSCVELLKGSTETGFGDGIHSITDVKFEGDDDEGIVVNLTNADGSYGTRKYTRGASETWVVAGETTGERKVTTLNLAVYVKQGLNDPPVLLATDRQSTVSRVVWDPNPQLENLDLGQAHEYKWKDTSGRDWEGGIYSPSSTVVGARYPLVIQTHGFDGRQFAPSGGFTTAFAARELAATGILVLQVPEGCPYSETPDEAPCNVRGYEAAVSQLVSQALVDPDRIGIVGFSRTCEYVFEALTRSDLHFAAASITGGMAQSYLVYLANIDYLDDQLPRLATRLVGAPPFGVGLQEWLTRAPGFNIDKVNAPLQITSQGRENLLWVWEPYATLRYLHKPVDLVVQISTKHVLTNPAERMASQGGTVDWFRFWLQGYEDSNKDKAEQYRRWEKLCDMQVEQNPDRPAFCVRSKAH